MHFCSFSYHCYFLVIMSLRVGLGASQADLDVQGEIDFDFFEASDNTNTVSKNASPEISKALKSELPLTCITSDISENNSSLKKELERSKSYLYSQSISESKTSYNCNKPVITVSCDDVTGVVQKTTIEAVIPTPFSYKDNKCGKVNSLDIKKTKKASSPYLKNKVFKDEIEISDDSSISSMSSESVSSLSEDSFELKESDSMTDVSSLTSPYACYSPTNNDQSTQQKNLSCYDKTNEVKKDGVKFIDDLDKQPCAKCNTIDFHELVNAMNRLQMKQNINMCARNKSPVVKDNSKCRKNFSFSNEEVRRIDTDNQNLLKKIIAQQNRPKSISLPASQIRSSSAVNRHRQQHQIELENLALLKRLESTKPSRNLSRSHLLRDYEQRSSGVLSRATSRSSYPSSCQASLRHSNVSSGRSSSINVKSSHSPDSHASLFHSRSATAN